MTGVKKLSSCSVAAFLCCGSAMAASPTNAFDAWTVSNGTIISTEACPADFSCTTETTGDGFYQRPIEVPEEQQHFGTIVTDNSSNEPLSSIFYRPGFSSFRVSAFHYRTPLSPYPYYDETTDSIDFRDVTITDSTYFSPDLSSYAETAIGPILPGKSLINWYIKRPDGIVTNKKQEIYSTPMAYLGPNQIAAEGSRVTISAHLNGVPDNYPVSIPISFAAPSLILRYPATASDYNIDGDSEIIIENGLSGEVTIQINEDDINDDGEKFFAYIGVGTGITFEFSMSITISEQAQPPLIDFSIRQDTIQSRIISTLSGNATITTEIKNPNPKQQLSYDWSATDNAIVPLNGSQQSSLEFAPNSLTPGIYKARLTVTDNNNLKSIKEIAFAVINTEIPGTDKENVDHDYDGVFEGAGDNDKDGLPDFADFNKLPNNYIFNLYNPDPLNPGNPSLNFYLEPEEDTVGLSIEAPYIPNHQEIPYMIETQPGLHLSRGEFSLLLDQHYQISNMIPRSLIEPADPLFSAEGIYSDAQKTSGLADNISNFVINNLPNAGGTATFVLPLPEAITNTPLSFRVLLPSSGWQSFDETTDSIASAARKGFICPAPNSPAYQAGLNPGDECLLFTVKDGGLNDSDEQSNGSITMALGTLIGIEAEPRGHIEVLNVDIPAEKSGGGMLSSLFLLFAALGLGLRHNAFSRVRRT